MNRKNRRAMRTMLVTGEELRQCFYDWIRGGRRPRFRFADIQPALAEMTDTMPDDLCRELAFALGTSVGHAARCLIVVGTRDGKEHRIVPTIGFESEEQSMEWWQRNKDNPERVVLRATGEKAHIDAKNVTIRGEKIHIDEAEADTFEIKIAR
jgi:hypothetical protein